MSILHRSHMKHIPLKHPVRFFLLTPGLIMSAWYAPFANTASFAVVVFYFIPLVLLFCSYIAPQRFILAFALTAVLFDITFPSHSANLLYAVLASVSLWSYITDARTTIAYVLILMGYQTLWLGIQHGETYALRMSMAYICLCTIAAFAGKLIKLFKIKEQHQLTTIHELRMTNNRVALQIHDACSHNLSRIDHAIKKGKTTHQDDLEARTIIESSLTNLRTEISQVLYALQHDGIQKNEEDSTISIDCTPLIRKQCDEWEQYLRNRGVQGNIQITTLCNPQKCQAYNLHLTKMYLKELFSNILRHANASQPFHIHISIGEKFISVMESNELTNTRRKGFSSGLASLRKEILELGGVWTTVQCGIWKSYVEIPLNISPTSANKR